MWSIDACPYSCCVFSLCFTTFFLSFSPFFYTQFLTTLLLWVVPPLVFSFHGSLPLGDFLVLSASLRCSPPPPFIHVYLFLLQRIDSMGFLPFTPRVSPTVFGLLWAFLQYCPPIHWLPGHYLCSEYVCCAITHFMTKFHFVCSCYIPLHPGSNG